MLPSNTLLVYNDTKVVAARLFFEKENGSTIEIFCLEPADIYKDITTAMLTKKEVLWGCLIGGAKKWKEGSLHIKSLNPKVLFLQENVGSSSKLDVGITFVKNVI